MITIFTNPRPFVGPFDLIQRNAIKSWLLLKAVCDIEIILIDDEEHTSQTVAQEYGIQCLTGVQCNENGTPLIRDIFQKIQSMAKYEVVAQVNTDIILMRDFAETIIRVQQTLGSSKDFFMIGRRWDFDFREPLDTENHAGNWENVFRERVFHEGCLHGLAGIDYWVFTRSLNFDPPSFVVGRPGIDSWLVYRGRQLRIPVIDATEAITIVHQNHDYPMKKKDYFEAEKRRNIEIAGGLANMLTLRDANWRVDRKGLKRQRFPRNIFSSLSLFPPWRAFLAAKRRLRRMCERV